MISKPMAFLRIMNHWLIILNPKLFEIQEPSNKFLITIRRVKRYHCLEGSTVDA